MFVLIKRQTLNTMHVCMDVCIWGVDAAASKETTAKKREKKEKPLQ